MSKRPPGDGPPVEQVISSNPASGAATNLSVEQPNEAGKLADQPTRRATQRGVVADQPVRWATQQDDSRLSGEHLYWKKEST
jgi:hypothetical protein